MLDAAINNITERANAQTPIIPITKPDLLIPFTYPLLRAKTEKVHAKMLKAENIAV